MNTAEQFELIPPHDVLNEKALKPYRSGTSTGYAHIPVELNTYKIPPAAKWLFVSILIADSLGQEIPSDVEEWAKLIALPLNSLGLARDVLEASGMIKFDSDGSIEIFEPEFWKA